MILKMSDPLTHNRRNSSHTPTKLYRTYAFYVRVGENYFISKVHKNFFRYLRKVKAYMRKSQKLLTSCKLQNIIFIRL